MSACAKNQEAQPAPKARVGATTVPLVSHSGASGPEEIR